MRKHVHSTYGMKKGGWKKQAKKALASVLAAAMVITGSAVIPPQNATVAEAADVIQTIGAEDLSTAFWGAHGKGYAVEEGTPLTIEFDNYSKAVENWQNFVMVFTNDGESSKAIGTDCHAEYAVVRADNWGWGGGNGNSSNGTAYVFESTCPDWETFKSIMKDAHVALTVERNGATVKATANIVSNTDNTKTFVYKADIGIDAGVPAFLSLTVDNACVKVTSVSALANVAKHKVTGNSTRGKGSRDI